MQRALELASAYRTHPNPRVGAVVLDSDGRVVGEGAHLGLGTPHAEVLALERAGARARGGTLYVTLEPCRHHGHTPPCVDAITASGVSRVVVGAIDPDPRMRGAAVDDLRRAGIEVEVGQMAQEAEAVDPAYFHHRRTGRPRVTLKVATTLDGQTAALDGSSQWLTSEEARVDSHRLRAEADAVMIGARTLRRDDPRLDVRIPDYDGPQPVPVIVAGREPLPDRARIWERNPVVVTAFPRDLPAGRTLVVEGEDGLPNLRLALPALGGAGLLEILVEGGAALLRSLWAAGLIDRGFIYLGAKLAGGVGRGIFGGRFEGLGETRDVAIRGVRTLGPDLRIEFE